MGGKRIFFIKEGDKLNYLTFISESFTIGKSTGHKVRVVKLKCDCGKVFETYLGYFASGRRKSCGCKNIKSKPPVVVVHGMTGTRIYQIWHSAKGRCSSKKPFNWKYYGSRGITFCDEWNSFAPFYKWSMENGYTDELTLDRRDNDKGYHPNNCRWVTMMVQSNNTRANVFFEYEGERKTVAEWAREVAINQHTLYKRLVRKRWDVGDALTRPIDNGRSTRIKQVK